jgi:hypothetical protein
MDFIESMNFIDSLIDEFESMNWSLKIVDWSLKVW